MHRVRRGIDSAGLLQVAMPDQLSDAEGATGVAGSRLNPDALERAFAQQPAVGDAVEGDSPRETEVFRPGRAVRRAGHAEHDLFADDLYRAGEVHLPLCELRFRDARRTVEQLGERPVRHRETGEVVEELLVEGERAVLPQGDDLPIDRIDVLGLAVGRETHHLVLARIDLEAGEVGERRIQQTE